MILHDLFESKMGDLDIQYQDYKNLEPVAFYSRYKMSKDDWASKYWSLIKSSETVHEDWQKVNKKDRTAGMSKKAVKAYRREHPGSKLQTAVTTKPSKLKKGSKASKRRKSYCSRSKGQMKMHNISCQKTPDKAICAARRRWNCEESVAEGVMSNLHAELANKYRELAPKIEKYKDSFLAGELYDALEAIAIKHNAELEFKRMLAGARNSAHMDYDTNPGGFQNWFWYLPFADDEQDIEEGSQQFGKHDPYWVCVNGKKWKRFETYEHARAVHDKLEKKLRNEGSDKKVSLLAADLEEGLRDPKDNPCWKGYKPVGTKQKAGKTVPNCVPKE